MSAKSIQLCPTLCDPMDCSPPGPSVHRILQARILEWVAISFSRWSSWPRDGTWVSCIAGRLFTIWATREAQWREKKGEGKLKCVNTYTIAEKKTWIAEIVRTSTVLILQLIFMACFPTIYPMFSWFSISISAGLDFLPEEVNQTLIPVGAEPFVVQLLSSYCSFPLTSATGSGGGSPVIPLSPIHIPSPPPCVPCCHWVLWKQILRWEFGVQGAC